MAQITKYTGSSNIGGICEIRFLKRSDFENSQLIIERYRGKNGIIKMSANDELLNVFEKIYHTHYLGFHEQGNSRSVHGLSFTQNLTFSVPKDRPEILDRITQLQDEPLTVIFRNNNDDWKVVGTDEDWAMMQMTQQTGADTADPNKIIFEVICNSRYLSPFLEFEKREIVPPPPPPQECFDGGEGLSFVPGVLGFRELRKSYSSSKYTRVGTYRLHYQVSTSTRIFIRRNIDMSIMHVFSVDPGIGQRDFLTGGVPFTVVVESIAAFPNYFSVESPCLPSP